MTRKEALSELIAKVEAGHDWSQVSGTLTMHALGMDHVAIFGKALDGSLDAAKALHEAVLPGWSATVDMLGGCDMFSECGDDEWEWRITETCADSPTRAWLLAILRTLHALEGGDFPAPRRPVFRSVRAAP